MCRYPEQDRRVEELNRQGFRFLTWVKRVNGQAERVAVLARRHNDGTEYVEVRPDGSFN